MRDAPIHELAHCATIAATLGEFAEQAAPVANALQALPLALCESQRLPHRRAFDRVRRFFQPREALSSEHFYWAFPDAAVQRQSERRCAAPRDRPAPAAVLRHRGRTDLERGPYIR